jgi:hypothetical protein
VGAGVIVAAIGWTAMMTLVMLGVRHGNDWM